MKNEDQALWNTLDDVVAALERSYPPEKAGGLLMAAEMFSNYFKRPRHEITMDMMKDSIKLLPLFLAWRRLPLNLIDLMVAEGKRLVTAAKLIARKRKGYKQLERRMCLRLDESDFSFLYRETKGGKAESIRRRPGVAIEASALPRSMRRCLRELRRRPLCEPEHICPVRVAVANVEGFL